MTSDFRARVLAATRRIPPGRVATYGDIAALAGRPRAARAVGNIMRGCSDHGIPCHRVVGAAGALGGYGGYLQLKRELLRAEGVEAGERRIRRFEAIRWQAAMIGSDPHAHLRRRAREAGRTTRRPAGGSRP